MITMKTYKVYWKDGSVSYPELTDYQLDHMKLVLAVTKIRQTQSYIVKYSNWYTFATLDRTDVIRLRKQEDVKSVKPSN